jgi:hypothetical protein
MMASSSSEQTIRARAWLLHAEFDVAEHPQIANPATNRIFPIYVEKCLDGRGAYLDQKMKGMTLISLSLPTDLSSLHNRGVVPVSGIFHGSHEVSMGTIQALFRGISGLATTWGTGSPRASNFRP